MWNSEFNHANVFWTLWDQFEYLIHNFKYRFYKTLKSWLEDPRLHDEMLHLPGLPPQYAPDRLKIVFSHYGVSKGGSGWVGGWVSE